MLHIWMTKKCWELATWVLSVYRVSTKMPYGIHLSKSTVQEVKLGHQSKK